MRILYGVVGEGMGHATRSRVVLDELCKRHDVQVVVSGRAHDYLQRRENEQLKVQKIWGYSLVYEDNEVRKFKTLIENVKGAITGWPENVRAYFEVAEKFQPDVVISDFETWSYFFGQRHALPVLSVDNMQIIHRCQHPPEILDGVKREFALANAIVKAKVPNAFHYYITTFFYPELRKERTSLHPPILRPEILAARAEPGEHLLVYQTSTSNAELRELLANTGRPCRVYGMVRDLKEPLVDRNLTFMPFSEAGFIDDLRSAAGVVSSAGFTLMSEAIYLHKPLLAVPTAKQFEQIINARYLERAGYGLSAEEVTRQDLGQFLERLPEFSKQLASYAQDGNRDLLSALEHGLEQTATDH